MVAPVDVPDPDPELPAAEPLLEAVPVWPPLDEDVLPPDFPFDPAPDRDVLFFSASGSAFSSARRAFNSANWTASARFAGAFAARHFVRCPGVVAGGEVEVEPPGEACAGRQCGFGDLVGADDES